MAYIGLEAYVPNGTALALKFKKGDAPAYSRPERFSDVNARALEREKGAATGGDAEEHDGCVCHDVPKGWEMLISPAGQHYYLHEESGKTSITRPSSTRARVHQQSPDIQADPNAIESVTPTVRPATPVAIAKGMEAVRGDMEGSLPPTKTPDSRELLRSDPGDPSPDKVSSCNSSVTRVEYDEADSVEYFTKKDNYANVSYFEWRKDESGNFKMRTGVVEEDINTWMQNEPSEDHPFIRLMLIPVVTNASDAYLSEQTFRSILENYQLPTELTMFTQSPQMMTYQFRIPIDEDNFVVHARSAVSASVATQLCYRYRRSSKSVCGVLLDRRERADVYCKRILPLTSIFGEWDLPLVALAQLALEVSCDDADTWEDLYYRATKHQRAAQSASSEADTLREAATKLRNGGLEGAAPKDMDRLKGLLAKAISKKISSEKKAFRYASKIQGSTTTRRLQGSAINRLLEFLKNRKTEGGHPLISFLDYAQSVNDGNLLVGERHQQRLNSLILESQHLVQTGIQRDTYENAEVQKELLRIMNITNEKNHDLLGSTTSLAEQAKQLQKEAGSSGKFMALLAGVTALFLPTTTIAGIAQAYDWPQKIFWPVAGGFTSVVLFVVFGSMYYCGMFHRTYRSQSPAKPSPQDKSTFATLSIVQDANTSNRIANTPASTRNLSKQQRSPGDASLSTPQRPSSSSDASTLLGTPTPSIYLERPGSPNPSSPTTPQLLSPQPHAGSSTPVKNKSLDDQASLPETPKT